MKKKELISKISQDADLTKKQAGEALNAVLDGITSTLEQGDKVTLVGFGTFSVKERKERKGINPRTKESIIIPAKKVPKFKAGKRLKESVK